MASGGDRRGERGRISGRRPIDPGAFPLESLAVLLGGPKKAFLAALRVEHIFQVGELAESEEDGDVDEAGVLLEQRILFVEREARESDDKDLGKTGDPSNLDGFLERAAPRAMVFVIPSHLGGGTHHRNEIIERLVLTRYNVK
jgi:hypothetical protein